MTETRSIAKRILVVAGAAASRFFAALFRQEGWIAIPARNRQEAERRLQIGRIQLAILDTNGAGDEAGAIAGALRCRGIPVLEFTRPIVCVEIMRAIGFLLERKNSVDDPPMKQPRGDHPPQRLPHHLTADWTDTFSRDAQALQRVLVQINTESSSGGEEDEHMRRLAAEAAKANAKIESALKKLAQAHDNTVIGDYCDLNAILQDLAPSLQSSVSVKIPLRLELCPSPCFIATKRLSLERLLLQLAVHVRDAIQGNGRCLMTTRTISQSQTINLPLPVLAQGNYAQLTISFSGPASTARPFFENCPDAAIISLVKECNGYVHWNHSWGDGASLSVFFVQNEAPMSDKD